ncbi:AAA family ATPase [Desulfonatronospira sp.]|uniref:ParA family protein n=1 Tax=Desulfonatronospira sp. TaxID=1962951 RepID=UPI0025BEE82D|nr:AAA family ATPase [Desulfonatronospira sp.]
MIIAVINNKGGTAKTTTSVNLAAGLARSGEKTLLVDLDSQASAALSLGVPNHDLTPSMSDALLQGRPIEEIIRSTAQPGLDMVVGNMDLANTDLHLADVPGRERRLIRQLQRVRTDYAWVFLDCPPSLSMLSINALVAADFYLIPVKPEYLSLQGLFNLDLAIKRLKKGMNLAPRLAGILLTIVHPSSRVVRQNINEIRKNYPEDVFETYIRQDVRLLEAPAHGQSIFSYSPGSSGARAYARIVEDMKARIKRAAT